MSVLLATSVAGAAPARQLHLSLPSASVLLTRTALRTEPASMPSVRILATAVPMLSAEFETISLSAHVYLALKETLILGVSKVCIIILENFSFFSIIFIFILFTCV